MNFWDQPNVRAILEEKAPGEKIYLVSPGKGATVDEETGKWIPTPGDPVNTWELRKGEGGLWEVVSFTPADVSEDKR